MKKKKKVEVTVHKLNTKEPLICPNCQAILDATSADHDSTPGDMDISICSYCFQVNIFHGAGENMTLAKMTEGEEEQLKKEYFDAYMNIQRYILMIQDL